MNGNKFATGQILKKTGRSCEGADFSWLSLKSLPNPGLDLQTLGSQPTMPKILPNH